MTVVVTGATGHIGNTLVRELVRRGERVRAVTYGDMEHVLDGLPVERVRADTRDGAAVHAALSGARRVFHLAAVISIDAQGDRHVRAVNVEGTRNVVAACLAHGVERLVHTSSVHALDAARARLPIDETCPLVVSPDALPYDLSKADGERAVLEGVTRGLNAVIVNPSAVIGPHDYVPSLTAQGILSMMRSPVAVRGSYDWVDVRDVASGMLAAAEKGRTGERYLLSGQSMSIRGIAELLVEEGGRRPLLTLPTWLLRPLVPFANALSRLRKRPPLFTAHSLTILDSPSTFTHEKASRELGFSPRPLRESLHDALQFFRAQGKIPPRGSRTPACVAAPVSARTHADG
jgi:dihydroflavonol-4-reductase